MTLDSMRTSLTQSFNEFIIYKGMSAESESIASKSRLGYNQRNARSSFSANMDTNLMTKRTKNDCKNFLLNQNSISDRSIDRSFAGKSHRKSFSNRSETSIGFASTIASSNGNRCHLKSKSYSESESLSKRKANIKLKKKFIFNQPISAQSGGSLVSLSTNQSQYSSLASTGEFSILHSRSQSDGFIPRNSKLRTQKDQNHFEKPNLMDSSTLHSLSYSSHLLSSANSFNFQPQLSILEETSFNGANVKTCANDTIQKNPQRDIDRESYSSIRDHNASYYNLTHYFPSQRCEKTRSESILNNVPSRSKGRRKSINGPLIVQKNNLSSKSSLIEDKKMNRDFNRLKSNTTFHKIQPFANEIKQALESGNNKEVGVSEKEKWRTFVKETRKAKDTNFKYQNEETKITSMDSQSSLYSRDSMINLKLSSSKSAKSAIAALIRRASSRPNQTKKQKISIYTKGLWTSLFISFRFARLCSQAGVSFVKKQAKALDEQVGTNPGASSSKTLTELLKEISKEQDTISTIKLKNLLLIPPFRRDFDTIQKINVIMNERIPDFAKAFIDEQERLHICKYLRFDCLKKDTVLLWEEHICTCFYFLICGKVDIFKINKGSKLKLAVMKSGAIFGHARIKVEGATRSASAILLQDSILLTIERDDYMSYKQDLAAIHPKVLQLGKVSFFTHNKDLFDKMSRFFQLTQYKAGTLIHEETKALTKVFWCVEGELVFSQKIGIVSYKKILRPLIDGEILSPENNLVILDLETNHIGPGGWYPQLPEVGKDAPLVRYLGAEYLDNTIYREHFLEKTVELRVPYSIFAKKDCTLASVSFAEIGQIFPKELIYELVYLPMVHGFKTSELQEQYLSQITWEAHKKREMSQLIK